MATTAAPGKTVIPRKYEFDTVQKALAAMVITGGRRKAAIKLLKEEEGIELEVEFWVADPEKGRAELVSGVNHLLLGLIRSHQVTIPQASEKESSVPT